MEAPVIGCVFRRPGYKGFEEVVAFARVEATGFAALGTGKTCEMRLWEDLAVVQGEDVAESGMGMCKTNNAGVGWEDGEYLNEQLRWETEETWRFHLMKVVEEICCRS